MVCIDAMLRNIMRIDRSWRFRKFGGAAFHIHVIMSFWFRFELSSGHEKRNFFVAY